VGACPHCRNQARAEQQQTVLIITFYQLMLHIAEGTRQFCVYRLAQFFLGMRAFLAVAARIEKAQFFGRNP